MGFTLNFAGVGDQVKFTPVPAGKYRMSLVDFTEKAASDKAKNPGATLLGFQWEIVGPDSVDEKYIGRKVFDNITIVENSLWKLKAMLKAFGLDVPDDGDIDFDPNDFLGQELEAKIKVKPARKQGDAEYDARNEIAFFIIPGEDD